MVEGVKDALRDLGFAGQTCAGSSQRDAMWRRLVDFPQSDSPVLVVQAAVLPNACLDFARAAQQIAPESRIVAQVATGIVVVKLESLPEQDVGRLINQQFRPAAERLGGSLTIDSYRGREELDGPTWFGVPPNQLQWMTAVKDQFDTKHLLNPGRFVFA